jgi:hypothetical protein
LTRPEWGETPFVFARYLLPVVPLVLLAVACGAAAIAGGAPEGRARVTLATTIAAVVTIALAATSPLRDWTRHPTSNRLGIASLYDFRPGPNPARETVSHIPMSPFWQSLAAQPRGSIVVAAAPFRFESYDWDAPRWERKSAQRVNPRLDHRALHRPTLGRAARRGGLRVPQRGAPFRRAALAARGVDYVVWQRPWVPYAQDRLVAGGDDTSTCEAALRARFGAPAYEDANLVAFRLSDARR